jgi:cytochrome P450
LGFVQELLALHVPRHSAWLRTGLGLARELRPVLRVGNQVLVTGAEPVREVLGRDQDFLSGVLYAPKMKLGPFVLGMDKSDQYLAERAALMRALHDKAERFAALVAAEARATVLALRRERKIELVSSFVEPVMVRAASRFYGVPTGGAKSSYLGAREGDATFALWLRKLGAVIGSSNPAPFGLEALAERLADELRPQLRRAVARHRDHTLASDEPTIISELLADRASPLEDEGIVRSVGGMMLAGATVCKAFVHALHALLERPAELNEAAERRRDPVLVRAYLWEALRFAPVFPFLVRYCPRATTIATRTRHATEVPAGALVVASLAAAMFDPWALERPETFCVGRPAEAYLHFGAGLHRCLGEWLAGAALPAMFSALCELPGLIEAAPGRFAYDGPAIDRYDLALERAARRRAAA